MASNSTSILLTFLCFFTLFFNSITANSNSSFYFKNFRQNSSFHSVFSLHGDAKVSNNGSVLQLTAPLASSYGRLIYKKRINFYGGKPKKLVSFSTYFTFSISSEFGNGDGLAFVVFSDGNFTNLANLFDDNHDNGSFGVSAGDLKFLSVEFDTKMDYKYGDMNGNHVGIDLSNFVSLKATNLSLVNLELNSGNILQVWVDYESGSRRLEVRVSKFGENRPVDPLLWQEVDLPKIWNESEGFYVGLSSANGNSTQICNVFSWSFKTRKAPDWMHSEPLDPIGFKQGKGNEVKVHKKDDCVMKVLSALILGVGLGALGSFVGMFVWTLFAKRRPVSPEEYAVKPVVDCKSFSK